MKLQYILSEISTDPFIVTLLIKKKSYFLKQNIYSFLLLVNAKVLEDEYNDNACIEKKQSIQKKTALDWVKSMGLRTVCPLREKKRKEKALNCQATVHIYSTKALPRAFPRPLLKRLNQPIVLSSWTFRTEGNPTLLQTR